MEANNRHRFAPIDALDGQCQHCGEVEASSQHFITMEAEAPHKFQARDLVNRCTVCGSAPGDERHSASALERRALANRLEGTQLHPTRRDGVVVEPEPMDPHLDGLLNAQCDADKGELFRLAADLLVEIEKGDKESLLDVIASVLTESYRMGLAAGADVFASQIEHNVKARR